MSKYQEAKETIMSNYPPENYTMLREALDLAMSLLDKEKQGYYLKRVDDLEQIKSLETNQLLLAIDITGKKTIINKWYINSKQELIYSDNKDRINLKMYFGIIEANSYIRDLYIL